MRGQVVDVPVRAQHDVFPAVRALRPLVAERDHVVRIERADQRGGIVDPVVIGVRVARDRRVAATGARFVGELPAHHRRVLRIGHPGHRIGARHHPAQVGVIERARLFVGVELRRCIGEGGPGMRGISHVHVPTRGAPQQRLQAARPLPEVGQDEHRRHPALGDLRHGEIEPFELRHVGRAVLVGEARFDRALQWAFFSGGHDAQIVDPDCFQSVKLADQARSIAVGRVRAEPCRVPHVRADDAVGHIPAGERGAFALDEDAAPCGHTRAGRQHRRSGHRRTACEERAPTEAHLVTGSSNPGTGISRASYRFTMGASDHA